MTSRQQHIAFYAGYMQKTADAPKRPKIPLVTSAPVEAAGIAGKSIPGMEYLDKLGPMKHLAGPAVAGAGGMMAGQGKRDDSSWKKGVGGGLGIMGTGVTAGTLADVGHARDVAAGIPKVEAFSKSEGIMSNLMKVLAHMKGNKWAAVGGAAGLAGGAGIFAALRNKASRPVLPSVPQSPEVAAV